MIRVRRIGLRKIGIPALCGGILAVGCYRPPEPEPARNPALAESVPRRVGVSAVRPAPRKPDATRIQFNRQTRTLTLYPTTGRWLLQTPREPRGMPIQQGYEFAPTIDVARVAVVLVSQDGTPSDPVTIAEIVAAQEMK